PCSVFSLMPPPPPASPLFPYTTLFRSRHDQLPAAAVAPVVCLRLADRDLHVALHDFAVHPDRRAARRDSEVRVDVRVAGHAGLRSEEHTSELQSRGHLVCRLLLEKKKQ